ncbi:hypothetical protein TraAM80_04738 [Trypanosoma rangeli]|uniref:Uncharacterized protein n=1 Tax=Trypanosoma rangeli TaxID=5698 RepID=A0A3R7MFW6_TRYRA|nr:uncharacterized protein TraAM80_04738 [Trypanosoma rangeli]RNF05092.1 hypothetical protein TraAM80_04738 [Trypanosoma rangeli]|eukprot:RNF05092.1 hypothetical protein TraAM80_04738 [Trypanosoma rangeli]
MQLCVVVSHHLWVCPVVVHLRHVRMKHGVGKGVRRPRGAVVATEKIKARVLAQVVLRLAHHHVAHSGICDVAVHLKSPTHHLVGKIKFVCVQLDEPHLQFLQCLSVKSGNTLLVGEPWVVNDGVQVADAASEVVDVRVGLLLVAWVV